MTLRLLLCFLFTSLTLACNPGRSFETAGHRNDGAKYNLKSDLDRYNGSYISPEPGDGHLKPDNLPLEILNYRPLAIQSVTVEYLARLSGGYLLTFNVNYESAKVLVVATLDSEYFLVDYLVFTNGLGSPDVTQDTIAIPSYHDSSVTVEIMHPNKMEEPEFAVDGIRKVELTISDDLRLINAR